MPLDVVVIATAPGKLILTGEYAVLDGAPALVIAVDRRVVADRDPVRADDELFARRRSPFLLAVAREMAVRYGADSPGARAALEIAVDSSAFQTGEHKLGLGSSAAVTVAASALAVVAQHAASAIDELRREIFAIALAAHGNAQQARGARGSGADVAAAVYGGAIAFTMPGAQSTPGDADDPALASKLARSIAMLAETMADDPPRPDPELPTIERCRWPSSVVLIPFFTGVSADTATLVSRIDDARITEAAAVDAALSAIADASRAACAACRAPADLAASGLLAALHLAGLATDRLASAAGVPLVPACVTAARLAMQALGGTAKTTGAGGGDTAIAVIPAASDVTVATRSLIELGCQPLQLTVDDRGVDTRLGPQ